MSRRYQRFDFLNIPKIGHLVGVIVHSSTAGSVPVVGVGLGRKQLAAAALCWLRSSCSSQRGRTTMYRDHDAEASF